MAGTVQAIGVWHRLIPSVSGGYGYLGILVVLLSGFQAIGVPFVAFFFAAVTKGSVSLPLDLQIDSALGGVMQGIIVLLFVLAQGVRRTCRSSRRYNYGKQDLIIFLTLASMLADSAPLVFAVIGETISEKAGVTNLSLDGSILLSAMVGFAVAFTTDNLYLAFLAAMFVGALVASIVAFSSIVLKLDQIAVGFVLTLLCTDLSTFFGNPFVRKPGPAVPHLPIPFLADIPVIGKLFFDQNVVIYLSFILIAAAWW